MTDFAMRRTCQECPWLLSSKPGKFPPSRYYELADTCVHGGLHHSVFGCHMTPEGETRACAGMLLMCGPDLNRVRLAVLCGDYDPKTTEALGPLYPSYRAMAVANGCDPDHWAFDELPEDGDV